MSHPNSLEDVYRKMDAIQPDEYGCLNWPSAGLHGYGLVRITGNQFRVARVALERALGRPIKPGYYACHDCDNKRCFSTEPGHVYEGTPANNAQDMVERNLDWVENHQEALRILNKSQEQRERMSKRKDNPEYRARWQELAARGHAARMAKYRKERFPSIKDMEA
jgi:hypothetical protein